MNECIYKWMNEWMNGGAMNGVEIGSGGTIKVWMCTESQNEWYES